MRIRPAVAASAAVVLLAAPVVAAVGDAPAQARAVSSFSLLDLSVGSTDVRLLDVALQSALGTPSELVVTPLAVDGVPHLQHSVDEGETVPSLDTAALAPGATGLASVVTPPIGFTSADGVQRTGVLGLPQLTLLGLPVELDGAVEMTTAATASGAQATHAVVVRGLALPSLADLLTARGLDVAGLPLDVLVELVEGLGVGTAAFTTAQAALSTATAGVQAQLDAAQADVDAARAALAPQLVALADAQADLLGATAARETAAAALVLLREEAVAAATALAVAQQPVVEAQSALDAALALAGLAPGTPYEDVPFPLNLTLVAAYEALEAATALAAAPTGAAEQALAGATSAVTAGEELVDDLGGAVTAAQALVTATQTTVDGLQSVLDAALQALALVLTDVTAEVTALLGAALDALDSTPLLELDELELTTRAATTSASPGGQDAQVVRGAVSGLRVLGVALPDGELGAATDQVQAALSTALAATSAVLADALAPLGVTVPAPVVRLLDASTQEEVVDGEGSAVTTLSGLSLDWAALGVPSTWASSGTPGALSVRIASLRDTATFRPAVGTAAPVVDPGEPVAPDPGPTGAPAPVEPAPVDAAPSLEPDPDPDPDPVVALPAPPAVSLPPPAVPAPVPAPVPGTTTPPDAVPAPAVPPAAPIRPRTTPVALTLPRTGSDGVPLVALGLLAAAVGVHRRWGGA